MVQAGGGPGGHLPVAVVEAQGDGRQRPKWGKWSDVTRGQRVELIR